MGASKLILVENKSNLYTAGCCQIILNLIITSSSKATLHFVEVYTLQKTFALKKKSSRAV